MGYPNSRVLYGESDGKEDQPQYLEGGGIGVVTIHHFETNVDKSYDGNSSSLTNQTMTTSRRRHYW